MSNHWKELQNRLTEIAALKEQLAAREASIIEILDIILKGSNRTDEAYNRGWNDAINSAYTNIVFSRRTK